MRRLVITILLASCLAPSTSFAGIREPSSESGGCVALSFDDGPDPVLTARLLSILEREKAPASFFVVGRNAAALPDLVHREFADGDEIGNHTWDHRLLTRLSDDEVVDEIALTDKAIIAATGLRPHLIRPPYGLWSPNVTALLQRRGLLRPIALWDVDSFDWLDGDSTKTAALASLAPSGSIVLMHDTLASTIAALPEIIRSLRSRNLKLTTIADLTRCTGADTAQSTSIPSQAHAAAKDRPGPTLSHVPSASRLLGALLNWTREHLPS